MQGFFLRIGYTGVGQLLFDITMKITLALHNLLMARFDEMSDELRSLAWSHMPPDGQWSRTPAQERFNKLMNLHYVLARYRRMWHQPSQPLTRTLRRGELAVWRSFYDVLGALTTCKPYLATDGVVAEIFALPLERESAWHYQYLHWVWVNLPDIRKDSERTQHDKVFVEFSRDNVVFMLCRCYPWLEFAHENVARHVAAVSCVSQGTTLGDELDRVERFMGELRPVFLAACDKVSTWEQLPTRLVETYEAGQQYLRDCIVNMPQEIREVVLKYPALLRGAVHEARAALN